MLTRDQFAVANLLVSVYFRSIECI